MMRTHVVFFSGGIGSWAAARRVAQAIPSTDRLVLLFTDTNIEDPDLYRFLREAAANVLALHEGAGELVWITNDGKTPWDVFREERFLGNTRVAPCSHLLKQEPAREWIAENCPDVEATTLHVGIDWTEDHRMAAVVKGWAPYEVRAPLMEAPLVAKTSLLKSLEREGIAVPRLYELGFPHNNCGGGCVKAGQAHFRHLLKNLPEVFGEWAANEEAMRSFLDRDVAILRDRRGGTVKPLPLVELARRSDVELDLDEWGGCGCFISEEGESDPGPSKYPDPECECPSCVDERGG